jgi:hypothetical protein
VIFLLKKKFLVIDVETAGGLDSPLVYDIGGTIIDKNGKIYEQFSFVVEEIFYGQAELMKSAYYAEKIPQYKIDLFKGRRRIATFWQIQTYVRYLIAKYGITVWLAYNARFDRNALNNTLQFLTNGREKYFFPYSIDCQCIWCMAKDTICRQKAYKRFCLENGYLTKNGSLKTSAEVVYKYLTFDKNFEECHTGLEDVIIETEIFSRVLRQHKKMRRHYWDKAVI